MFVVVFFTKEFGLMEETVGAPPVTMVNATVAEVSPLDVTPRARTPVVALAAIVRVAVRVVEFTLTKLPTVTPVPDTVIAVAESKY